MSCTAYVSLCGCVVYFPFVGSVCCCWGFCLVNIVIVYKINFVTSYAKLNAFE